MNDTIRIILILLAAVALIASLIGMRWTRTRWASKVSRSDNGRMAYLFSVALFLTIIAMLIAFRKYGVF